LVAVIKRFLLYPLSIVPVDVDQLFILIKIRDIISLIIGAVYFSPMCNTNSYNCYFNSIDQLTNKHTNSKLLGDYNLPKLKWLLDSTYLRPEYPGISNVEFEFVSSISFYNLTQFNSIKNPSQGLLDLVLSDIENILVSQSSSPLLKIDSHHPPLITCASLCLTPLTFSEVFRFRNI